MGSIFHLKQIYEPATVDKPIRKIAVVLSFFICWSSFRTQSLMADYVPATPTPLFDMVYTIIRHISGVTYYLSPTVNPILYQLMSLKFQQAFKDTFGRSADV
ncbi:pyrokinin-1 receptor [Caerostris extrusa]|uniref:Pyrokinin-1 receptor n=1 Tax=Caerostris extrusa TaxID=172846 RepID=A0AAV4MI18_CAEEX|nr:pyrokinin-1 receptor [Caerostris extrusa]